MWSKVVAVFLAGPVLLISLLANAQEPLLMSSASFPPADTGFVLRKNVDEIHLTFTVTDKQRHAVFGLERTQIELEDNQLPVNSVVDFRSDHNLPLQLALVIDASGSVQKYFASEQQAALSFVNRVLRPGSDRAFVAAFGNKFAVLDVPTADPVQLARSVAQLHAGGVTALYDALMKTYNELARGQRRLSRRAVVLLSDGEDNNSYHALADAMEGALRADIAVYAISLRGRATRGDDTLRELARTTGGRAFIVRRPEEVGAAFEEIEQELRSQYTITFRPGERDGRFHRLQVQVRGATGVEVRARAGYWAPGDREAGR